MTEIFKKKPFPFSMLVLITLITLHAVGSYFSWYWVYPWFDLIVHTVSGLWVASVILWLASVLGQINSLKEYKVKSFLIAFLAALLFGIAWEVFENVSQIVSTNASGYALNTALDLICDGFGGLLAYSYFIKRKKCNDGVCEVMHPFYNKTGMVKS